MTIEELKAYISMKTFYMAIEANNQMYNGNIDKFNKSIGYSYWTLIDIRKIVSPISRKTKSSIIKSDKIERSTPPTLDKQSVYIVNL